MRCTARSHDPTGAQPQSKATSANRQRLEALHPQLTMSGTRARASLRSGRRLAACRRISAARADIARRRFAHSQGQLVVATGSAVGEPPARGAQHGLIECKVRDLVGRGLILSRPWSDARDVSCSAIPVEGTATRRRGRMSWNWWIALRTPSLVPLACIESTV